MTAREAAYEALSSCRRSGAWSEMALNSVISKAKLDRKNASLATRICMGVLQNRMLLDWHISRVSSIQFSRIQPQIVDILRIGVYQIMFTDRIPVHAAVDESVKLARKFGGNASSGFVNALMRRIASERGDIPQFYDPDPVKELSVRYSHPEWLVNEYISRFGRVTAEGLLSADNSIPPVTVQVNTLNCDSSTVFDLLKNENAAVSAHALMPDCFELQGAGTITDYEAYRTGSIYIQDCAARAAVMAADPEPGCFLIDACAAPGGKSFSAAVMMRNEGRILSFDIHDKKLGRIRSGADRLGIEIIETRARDSRCFDQTLEGTADVVLADVPCSGMGVIRKKPEIRYKDESQIASLPDIQFDIISNLSKYVRPGGVLLYSTCTLLKRENEDVIYRFLDAVPGYVPEDFNTCLGCSEGGMLTLLPNVHGTDGFFICRLRRTK